MEQVQRLIDKVELHLSASEPGQDRYFLCLALREACNAAAHHNYGIGAVAVVSDESRIKVYGAGNQIVTPSSDLTQIFGNHATAIAGLFGHAEALAVLRSLCATKPDLDFSRKDSSELSALPLGVSVFGTVEPCPMCTCIMTNDTRVVRSVSLLPDHISAYSANERETHQPPIWTTIQDKRGLRFEIHQGESSQLRELSQEILQVTRTERDEGLATAHR